MGKDRLVLVLNNSGQWEDKTGDVARCITDSASGQVKISYKRNPKHEYSYRQERVRLLDATAALDPTVVRLRVGGRLLPNVDSITQYPDYYLVTATGYRKLYAASKVSVEQDAAATPACRNALEYFRAVAELVSLKNEDGQPILAGQYKYLSRLPDTSVLATYLTPRLCVGQTCNAGFSDLSIRYECQSEDRRRNGFPVTGNHRAGTTRHWQDADHFEHHCQCNPLRADGSDGIQQQCCDAERCR